MEFLAAVGGFIVPIILIVLVILILAANIKVVQQSKAYVVERQGAFHSVWGVGPLHREGGQGGLPQGAGGGLCSPARYHQG